MPWRALRFFIDTMNIQHSTTHQVMFYDTDCGGVVHNLAYLRWVEECRTTMATALNIDYVELAKQQQFMVVVRHEVDYLSPALLGDVLTCAGGVERVEKSSMWFQFEITRPADGRCLIRVRQRLALVGMPKGRPCRIPSEWHQLANN